MWDKYSSQLNKTLVSTFCVLTNVNIVIFIIFIIVMKSVCAARSPTVTTSWSALDVVPLACASQGTAVSLAVASDDLQQFNMKWLWSHLLTEPLMLEGVQCVSRLSVVDDHQCFLSCIYHIMYGSWMCIKHLGLLTKCVACSESFEGGSLSNPVEARCCARNAWIKRMWLHILCLDRAFAL